MIPMPRFDESVPCRQQALDTFFPTQADPMPEFVAGLRKMCMACHMFDECFDYAMAVDVEGIWAGTTHNQRKQMRKQIGLRPESVLAGLPTAESIRKDATARRLANREQNEASAV